MKRLQSVLLRDEKNKQSRIGLTSEFSETSNRKEEELIQLLLTISTGSKVSFLSLYSLQACEVYSDKKVIEFFDFMMWISPKKDDGLIRTRELSILLERVLVGKRFLLIIDDVWNHKEERDMFFKNLSIMSGKQGSKIILIKCATEITDLPDHILQKIFCKLPIRTIIGCTCVCKGWYKLIKDPSFPNMHLSQAAVYPLLRTFEPSFRPSELHMIEAINTDDLAPPLKLHSKLLPPQVPLIQGHGELDQIPKFGIVNSCNGLLCVCTTPFNNPIYVCNPITGEYIMLPKPPKRNPETNAYIMDQEEIGEMCMTDFVVSGFGFSPKTKQYKVMRVFGLETDDGVDKIVQVLTLGSSSWTTHGRIRRWRHIGLRVTHRQTLLPAEAPYRRSFCVYLNGAVHWLANRRSSPFFIGSFNFDSGDIVEILPPSEFEEIDDLALGNMRLGVLHDCLYLSDIACYVHFHLWVLKDYNNPFSWTKELVINNFSLNIWPRGLYRPIKYLDNGDLLMFHPSNALVCYNPKVQSFRYFKIRGIDSDFEMVPHVPSLISMKDAINVEDPQVEILNVRDCERVHQDWKEDKDLVLVEEDEDAISAAYSKILEENT